MHTRREDVLLYRPCVRFFCSTLLTRKTLVRARTRFPLYGLKFGAPVHINVTFTLSRSLSLSFLSISLPLSLKSSVFLFKRLLFSPARVNPGAEGVANQTAQAQEREG